LAYSLPAMSRLPRTLHRLLVVASLLVLTLGVCGCAGPDRQSAPAGLLGKPMPNFALSDLGGQEVSLESLRGKVVLIDFWATWCNPCHQQTKILAKLWPEVSQEDVVFLALNSGEPVETVKRFAAKSPFDYPVLLDPEDSVALKLKIEALPTLVVLDREGKISAFQEGLVDAALLRDELARAGA
jgi:cytochrome c biogenesis protein CcmG, thiol:disulfide interchange protein DsbE